MNNGWIKLHRSLLDWEWFDEPNTFRLFMYCLLRANHKPKNYRGKLVQVGSFLTSREALSHDTGLSERQVRTALDNLKTTNELTIVSSRQGTVIHVNNYELYQSATNETTDQTSNKRPTSDQQTTSNNNEKNNKNEKEDISPKPPKGGKFKKPSIEECLAYAKEKGYTWDVEHFWNHHESKGWMVGKNKMKSWQSAMVTWDKNDQKFNKKQPHQPITLHEWIQRGGTVAGFREYEQKNKQP